MSNKYKDFYKKLLNNKETLLKYVYFLQDKYIATLEDNSKNKASLKDKYKTISESDYNKISNRLDEKSRDLGILFRKTELLDDKIFRSFEDESWNHGVKKDFVNLILTQRLYAEKWNSWSLLDCYYRDYS